MRAQTPKHTHPRLGVTPISHVSCPCDVIFDLLNPLLVAPASLRHVQSKSSRSSRAAFSVEVSETREAGVIDRNGHFGRALRLGSRAAAALRACISLGYSRTCLGMISMHNCSQRSSSGGDDVGPTRSTPDAPSLVDSTENRQFALENFGKTY